MLKSIESIVFLPSGFFECMIKAMIDMILNQGFLGLRDGFLDRMKLLGDIDTLPPVFDHGDNAAKMPFRPL